MTEAQATIAAAVITSVILGGCTIGAALIGIRSQKGIDKEKRKANFFVYVYANMNDRLFMATLLFLALLSWPFSLFRTALLSSLGQQGFDALEAFVYTAVSVYLVFLALSYLVGAFLWKGDGQ